MDREKNNSMVQSGRIENNANNYQLSYNLPSIDWIWSCHINDESTYTLINFAFFLHAPKIYLRKRARAQIAFANL